MWRDRGVGRGGILRGRQLAFGLSVQPRPTPAIAGSGLLSGEQGFDDLTVDQMIRSLQWIRNDGI